MGGGWWGGGVVGGIYPRSFKDSNNDGIGDLQGIIQKLDYLDKLGIDVIWLNPIYESPNDDNGYDISNYKKIMNDFGDMNDFNQLLEEAHKKNIKIIMDLVVNHTSDEHAWFIESRKDKNNAYRDYYIWKDGDDGNYPNNWQSYFNGPAWTYDETTNQYYLHLFSEKQPDLNWDNEQLRSEVYDMMRYWLDKGVDGFRMDVINMISKDPNIPDDPNISQNLEPNSASFIANGPNAHRYINEMNKEVLSKYDVMTVGEMVNVPIEEALKYTGSERNELQMIFQWEHMSLDYDPIRGKWNNQKVNLRDLKESLFKWQEKLQGIGWNSLYWNNHDNPRCVSRFGDDRPEYRKLSAKMLATTLHLLQGTPYIYQGEEIGMTNIHLNHIEQYEDIETLNAYKELVENKNSITNSQMMKYIHFASRDNARTPMQWDSTKNAGFTDSTPWFVVNENYKNINVEASLNDSDSIFYYYQALIQLRKQYEIIVYGSFKAIDRNNSKIFAFERTLNESKLYVVSNFTDEKINTNYRIEQNENKKLLIGNYGEPILKNTLRPYETKVYLIDNITSESVDNNGIQS